LPKNELRFDFEQSILKLTEFHSRHSCY